MDPVIMEKEAKALEEMFASIGWQLVMRRFKPRLDEGSIAEYDHVRETLTLGRVQGRREILREIVGLKDIVHAEMAQTIDDHAAQAGYDEAVDTDWRG